MKKPLFFVLFFILCWSTSFAAERGIKRIEIKTKSGETVGLYEESHALVIGVSDYTAGWPDLESVAKDVDAVSASLEGHGFNVVRVLNPTKRELSAAFGDFIDEYGYDLENRLLFYYSGHGYTQELHGRQVGYLVPSDAPDPNEDQKGFFRRSLRMTQILSWSKQIQAKHALFLFDSCFSGSVLKERALVVPQQIRAVTDKPVRQFISAGSAGQTVPAESIFRPSFIRGIRGEADLDKDGYVTGTELGLFLQKRVASYETGQTPQFGKIKDPLYDEGDFVFMLPKAAMEPQVATAALLQSSTPAEAPKTIRADEESWLDIKNSKDPEDFRFFLEEFPKSSLAKSARFKLKRLERKQEKTKAEEQQLAGEEKRLEEERKRLEAEKKKIAEAKRKAENERKKQEELAALNSAQEAGSLAETPEKAAELWNLRQLEIQQLYQEGNLEGALNSAQESVSLAEVAFGSGALKTISSMLLQAQIHGALDQLAEANQIYQVALLTSVSAFGESDATTLSVLDNYGGFLKSIDPEMSEPILREALRLTTEDDPQRAARLRALGLNLQELGRTGEAEGMLSEALKALNRQ